MLGIKHPFVVAMMGVALFRSLALGRWSKTQSAWW